MTQAFRAFAVVVVLIIYFLAIPVSGQTRPRPANQPAPTTDFKVKYKVSYSAGGSGQSSESVTMIKGARERSEMRMGMYDMVNITQCDLKRTIQINDSARKYSITPMEVDTSTQSTTTAPTPTPAPTTPARTGGTVTYVTTSIDTGERREMFGFTARHVKSSTTIESSPDACNPVNMRTELDGWYIDLSVAFNCNLTGSSAASRMPAAGGCRDRTQFRRGGNGKLGYPLIETMSMYNASGQVTFTTMKEVLELTRGSLDVALFDIPAGYTEALNQQELYAAPSMTGMSGATTGVTPSTPTGNVSVPTPAASNAKQPGAIRVGVVQINNKSGKPVSAEALRGRLIQEIVGAGVEAIPLNGTSAAELDAEAKAKQCDFILYSDIAALKMGKLGGLFGAVTGTGVGKTEAKMEYKLFAVGETSPRLQSSSSAKEEGDENSAGVAIAAEARTVVTEVRKKRG